MLIKNDYYCLLKTFEFVLEIFYANTYPKSKFRTLMQLLKDLDKPLSEKINFLKRDFESDNTLIEALYD